MRGVGVWVSRRRGTQPVVRGGLVGRVRGGGARGRRLHVLRGGGAVAVASWCVLAAELSWLLSSTLRPGCCGLLTMLTLVVGLLRGRILVLVRAVPLLLVLLIPVRLRRRRGVAVSIGRRTYTPFERKLGWPTRYLEL